MRKTLLAVPLPAGMALAIAFGIPATWAQPGEPGDGPAVEAPPPEALNRQYPVCNATIRDECVNPRQAGMNYGHVPLDYWPGQPASEMRGAGYGSGWHHASRHIAKRPRN